MKVGFVGLGSMGGAVARDLLDSNHDLALCDIDRRVLDQFADRGANVTTSVTEVAVGREVIGVCVVDDAQCRAVVTGPGGLLESDLDPGTVIMLHSTISPETVLELAEAVDRVGCHLIDACLSAGPMSKTRVDRVVIVGGDPAIYERCLEVLDVIGTPYLVGPLGTGATVKLIHNLLVVAVIGASDVALRMGEHLGADRRLLERIFLTGSAASNPLSIMIRRRDRTSHRLQMLQKDRDLALALLERASTPLDGIDEMAAMGLRAVIADIAPAEREQLGI